MASIVVLGAGIGGMSVAHQLRALLGPEQRIPLMGDGEPFSSAPSNPRAAVGGRKPAEPNPSTKST